MKIATLLGLCALPLMAAASPSPQDSIGIKKMNGKLFIRHRVEKGEGLLALCRRYHVNKADVLAANEGMKESLNLGQEVLFPLGTAEPKQTGNATQVNETHAEADAEKPAEHIPTDNSKRPDFHTVKAGETLYRVAAMYQISETDLRTWNSLTENNLKEGQRLWLKNMQAASVPSKVNGADSSASKKDSVRNKTVAATPAEPHPMAGSSNIKEVEESGVARWFIDDELGGGHQLALHKTAPVGTIIKLTNRMTNKTVFVRVVGVLPNNDENKTILIKISRSTAEKIGMRDEQTQVKLNYALD